MTADSLAFGGAVGRRAPPEIEPWRIGLGALITCYIIAGLTGPLEYTYATTLLWLVTQLDLADAIAFLTPRLAERPVRTEWHRAYQVVIERSQAERDLIPEYRKLVETTGRSPDRMAN